MIDIPFLSSGLLSVFCYIRYRKTQAVYLLILSALFVTWSIFIRQLGVSFLLGIVLSDIVINKKIRKHIVWFFCLPLLSLFAFEWWLKNHPEIPADMHICFLKITIGRAQLLRQKYSLIFQNGGFIIFL